jgi:hypothetical protein
MSTLTEQQATWLWGVGYDAGRVHRCVGGDKLTLTEAAAFDLSRLTALTIRSRAPAYHATWWPPDAAQPDAAVADELWGMVLAGFLAALEAADWIAP